MSTEIQKKTENIFSLMATLDLAEKTAQIRLNTPIMFLYLLNHSV